MIIHVNTNSQLKMLQLKIYCFNIPLIFRKL